jgi:hypothetical protein
MGSGYKEVGRRGRSGDGTPLPHPHPHVFHLRVGMGGVQMRCIWKAWIVRSQWDGKRTGEVALPSPHPQWVGKGRRQDKWGRLGRSWVELAHPHPHPHPHPHLVVNMGGKG